MIKIIPQPYYSMEKSGKKVINGDSKVWCSTKLKEHIELFKELFPFIKSKNINYSESTKKEYDIELVFDKLQKEECYTIECNEKHLKISTSTYSGMLYAMQTLKQMLFFQLKKDEIEIPCFDIQDQPRFKYRGVQLDEARHFFGEESVKRLLRLMAFYKLNVLHWHLTDDQGWRVEIEKYPRLIEIGSKRKDTNIHGWQSTDMTGEPYEGYYTKAQIRDIVAYAQKLNITIIPEIDMPGHATAMLAAYPEYSCTGERVEVETRNGIFGNTLCPSKEKTASFAFDILDEIAELFPGDTIHIGGDETKKGKWKNCPHCQKLMEEKGFESTEQLQSYFTNRLVEHLKGKGKKAIVWNEALAGDKLDDSVTAQLWLDPKGNSAKWANRGNKVIVSDFFRYYADYPYEMTPLKKTYSFEPTSEKGFDDVGKRNVIGVETPIWTEFIDNFEKLGEQCFPRFLAVAESGWTGREYKNYEDFQSRVWFVKPIVNNLGIDYAPSVQWNVSGGKRFSGTLKFCTKLIAKPGKKHG